MRPIILLTFLTLFSASQINSEIDPIYEIVGEGVKEIEPINNDSLVHALFQKIKTTQTQNIYDMSLNALMVCQQIEMKTDSLANQIELTHTTDPNGQLNDKHNHEHVSRIMIEQNQGHELYEMLEQGSRILSIAARSLEMDHIYVVQVTTGDQEIPPNSSWWEHNFSERPGLAALPILRKINHDAYTTKIRFLNHISAMNR